MRPAPIGLREQVIIGGVINNVISAGVTGCHCEDAIVTMGDKEVTERCGSCPYDRSLLLLLPSRGT